MWARNLLTRDMLLPVYTVGVVGSFLQIAGGFWDVSWHSLGRVDTFFGINHFPLYAGVALALVASLTGLVMRVRGSFQTAEDRSLLKGLQLALVGGALQIVAGPYDAWWHGEFGFDPFLFTPSHTLLIAGIVLSGVGTALGTVRLLQAYRADPGLGKFPGVNIWFQLVTVVALATLWLVLNGLVYLVTDVDGIRYTFRLSEDFVSQTSLGAFIVATSLLALTGTLTLLTVKRVLRWPGAVSAAAGLVATVAVVTNLSFRAGVLIAEGRPGGDVMLSYIPLYLSFLIPMVLFDFSVRSSTGRRTALLAAVLVSPFASYLDGFYSLALWTHISQSVALLLLVPMGLAGLAAGLSGARFATSLLARRVSPTQGAVVK